MFRGKFDVVSGRSQVFFDDGFIEFFFKRGRYTGYKVVRANHLPFPNNSSGTDNRTFLNDSTV
jgi:hypothetical protein